MTPNDSLPDALAARVLEDTLDGLDVDARAAFVMHEIEQVPLDEVADVLDLAPSIVQNHLRLADEVVLDCLQEAGCDASAATVSALVAYARRPEPLAPRPGAGGVTEPAPAPRLRATAALRALLLFGGGAIVGALGHALLSPRAPAPGGEARTLVVFRERPTAPSPSAPPAPAPPDPRPLDSTPPAAPAPARQARLRPPPAIPATRTRADASASPAADAAPAAVLSEVTAAPDATASTDATAALESYTLEAALFDQALRATRNGDLTGVLDAQRRYEQQFPGGRRSEPMACLALRSCERAGDEAGARQHADAYLRRFPSGACAGLAFRLQGGPGAPTP